MTPDPEAIRDLWEVDLEQEDLPGRARRGRRRPSGAAATRGLHPRSSTRRRRRSGSGPTCPSATRRCSRPGSARSRRWRRWMTTCWRPGAAGSRTRTSSSVWVTCCIRRRSRRRVSALRSYPGRRSRRPSPPPRSRSRARPGPRRRVRDSLGCRASARLRSSRLGSSSWDGLRLSLLGWAQALRPPAPRAESAAAVLGIPEPLSYSVRGVRAVIGPWTVLACCAF